MLRATRTTWLMTMLLLLACGVLATGPGAASAQQGSAGQQNPPQAVTGPPVTGQEVPSPQGTSQPVSGQPGAGQASGPAASPSTTSDSSRYQTRLNPYFRGVVTVDQQESIYAIQIRYAQRIDALQQQIAQLEAEQAAEIERLLTPEQLAVINLKRDAAERRQQARARGEESMAESSP